MLGWSRSGGVCNAVVIEKGLSSMLGVWLIGRWSKGYGIGGGGNSVGVILVL